MTIVKLIILSLIIKLSALKTDTAHLAKLYNQNTVVGIDVRSTKEIKANPAKGALHIPLEKLESFVGKKVKEGTPIFVFCEAGYRAEKAKMTLLKLGHNNVTNIKDWRTWNKIRFLSTK